ncbi:potassium/proton antiporter [Methanobacterium paludis]|uniref:Sodium/hydrogen exchanger n=1 Tax=Methanobacterium paludis (strain DSM 25820 / JCM 18151 / SWAN1) TaxID=868131 RepID=F6D542_METPW|nr:potassium/proton antiporter [Methanobacterium paludis]AEG17577.1 sodium/hydrogen exchanger [Methanobacterium paludis]
MISEQFILIGSFLLFISIIISKTSHRLGIPSLLFFLLIGMLAGSEGIGGIYFNNPIIAQFIGIIALVFILFSGGLDTKWGDVKPVLWRGVILSTVGVLITTLAVGLFINWITGFSLIESFLIGSIVSSTDAAAVFSIFRSQKQGLKNNIEPTLELESGTNDPMAYFMTTTLIFLILNPATSVWSMIMLLVQSIGLGVVIGVVFGKGMVKLINNIKLHIEGLYPVLTIALSFLTFSVTYFVGGNGFLSVYIAALILGNSHFVNKKVQMQFYDGMATLMQIIMFLTLGLLVFPSQIIPVMGIGILISFFLILVARPLAVFLCLSPFKVGMKDKVFISWVGIRGAVPIIFATYPIVAGVNGANMIFNIVFFITMTSALIQGSTINVLARYLGLSKPKTEK